MDFIVRHILTLILFLPTAAAAVIFFLPKDKEKLIKWVAFLSSLLPLIFTVILWNGFQGDQAGFQFQEQAAWFPSIASTYHLGIDGISLPMVLLTTLLTPLALLASFSIKDRIKPYMILFLLLETGMLGVFVSLDLLLFFVFWEIGLVPMYFLINQWGGENRNYASLKFILYTMAGSLGLLLSIQLIGVVSGTFDLPEIFKSWPSLTGSLLGLPIATVKSIAFWAFVIAFAIKVPVWPFHTWLPDAHTEAPTPGSMILAGVLLKLGAYGFPAAGAAPLPGGSQNVCRRVGFPGSDGDHLWRIRRIRPAGFQETGGVLLHQPYGICRPGYRCWSRCRGHSERAPGSKWRCPANVQPRSLIRRYVLPGGRDLRTHPYPQPG